METDETKAGAIFCLEKTREILGPVGEHWAQGFFAYDKDGRQLGSGRYTEAVRFCVIGALQRAACPYLFNRLAAETLDTVAGKKGFRGSADLNDKAQSFQDVETLISDAISELKGSEGNQG